MLNNIIYFLKNIFDSLFLVWYLMLIDVIEIFGNIKLYYICCIECVLFVLDMVKDIFCNNLF